MIRNAAFLTFILLTTCAVLAQVFSSSDAAKKLHALFDEDWQWGLQQYPESATMLGDNRYNDRLTDYSMEAIERRKAHERDVLERVQKIDRSQLNGQDVISYDLFLREKKLNVEGARFPTEYMPIDQMNGVQISFGQLVGSTPFRNAKDYEHYVARLGAFARQIDQLIALMKRGIETKWLPPSVPLRSVPAQIEGQIADDPTKSPFFSPFARFPQDGAASQQTGLVDSGKKMIAESLTPALKKLHAFIKQTYLPICRADIGASSLPDGEPYYQYAIRRYTTTDLTAKEIHEIGKREVARIHKEMEAIVQQAGFKGSFQQFLTFLRTDPRFYYSTPADLVAGYSHISKRADGKLPELFAELPRTPYGVKVIPDYEAPAQTTAYYQPGAADGSRAGFFMINTYKLNTRPKYEMEALTLHESVPGHHLQIARSQELNGLPDFRRNAGYTAYIEGWGLYAESLGTEIGFYADPYSKFGQLTYEMWRACRLVVDTGMHSFGWSRQQAIDFMKENTAKTENDIMVEIDRYIVWPGQALAYKIGELKIKEIRAKASKELGARFDVRKFHNAVLDDGPLPLELLEHRINEWIAAEKRKEYMNTHGLERAGRGLICLILLVLIGCSTVSQSSVNNNQPSNSNVAMENQNNKPIGDAVDSRVVAANTTFGFKLFAEVAKQDAGKNILVSPASVGLALAMTYNGAVGETKQGMERALEIQGINHLALNQAYSQLRAALESADPKVQLSIANSLWGKKGVTFNPDFIQRNKQYYGAEVSALDFGDPRSPAAINSWVSDKTKGKISQIIDRIDAQAILFLINAIYFKGSWAAEFDKAKTTEDQFTTLTGKQKRHPMMHQSGKYRYYAGKNFQAVSLPYGGGRVSMYLFLPAKGTSLVEFQKSLSSTNWDSWMREFAETKGEIAVPRFRVEYEIGLNDALKALGMGIAFDPNRADFSGIVKTSENVFISRVKHKTFAEVNEEGTEAAAATSVEMSVTSAMQPRTPFRMIVDRPFFCVIRDNKSGALLFMGSITDPM